MPNSGRHWGYTPYLKPHSLWSLRIRSWENGRSLGRVTVLTRVSPLGSLWRPAETRVKCQLFLLVVCRCLSQRQPCLRGSRAENAAWLSVRSTWVADALVRGQLHRQVQGTGPDRAGSCALLVARVCQMTKRTQLTDEILCEPVLQNLRKGNRKAGLMG